MESIFTYRPFKVVNEGIRPEQDLPEQDLPEQDLQCNFIDDQQPTFSVKQLTLRQTETEPVQYQLLEALDCYKTYDEVTRKGDRKPYGGAILKYDDTEYVVFGAMTFTDDDRRDISPVFFCPSSGHEHHNQEINVTAAERTEAPNQEATVSAAAAADTLPPHLDETNGQSLTGNRVQVEAEDTVDAAADNETAQQPTPGANSYDHHYGEEQNVPDPANADEVVVPNPSNEAARYEDTIPDHEHHNQEGNAPAAGRIESPNLSQEAMVSAAAATPKESPQPDETNVESLTINCIQEGAKNTVDAVATDNKTAQHSTPGANSYDHLFVSELEKYSVQDKLAPYLDHTSHRVIKTWEHLACELKAPLETRLRCKLNQSCSRTQMLIDFIAVEMTQKTVKDLIVALKAIKRNDVVEIITAKYPENSTKTITDFNSSESEMIDEMATKLDQKSRVTGNWTNLGWQFKVHPEKLREIEYNGPFNPTLALMEYLYSRRNDLTVRKFYDEVDGKLNRQDVLMKLKPFLDKHSEELMEKVIPLESDDMRSVCVDLNNPNSLLKNWRRLASAFKVPSTIYNDFNPEKPLSSTKLLFEWIFANRRDLTVGQLCTALSSIERLDVEGKLREYLEQIFTGQE